MESSSKQGKTSLNNNTRQLKLRKIQLIQLWTSFKCKPVVKCNINININIEIASLQ